MQTAIITYRERLEARFDAIPPRDLRGGLKAHGFEWDSRARCWWLSRPVSLRFVRNEPITQDGFQYALSFCQTHLGLTADQAAQLTQQHHDACETAAIRGMEEACGIA
jgi:hypothetical protein